MLNIKRRPSRLRLYFTIDKNQLARDDDNILASYSRNINKCVFCCGERLGDIYKYALFTGVLGEQYIEELGFGRRVTCKIPNDILKGNYFSVSVFGGNRFTTTQENVLIQPSGFTDKTEDLFESGKSSDVSSFEILQELHPIKNEQPNQ